MSDRTLINLMPERDERTFAEPGLQPNYAPASTVRITHIDLALSIEPRDHQFSGVATIRLEPLLLHRGLVTFDLDEVEVSSVSNEVGDHLDFIHEDGHLEVDNIVGPSSITVVWRGEKPRRGLYFTGPTTRRPDRQQMAWTQCQDQDARFIFPCIDQPGMKCSYSIKLDAPVGYTLLSNGELVSSGEVDGRSVAHFEQRHPMPSYLFTAVAAKLSCFEAKGSELPIRYLVPEGEEANVTRAFGKTPLMIEEFSRKTGVPYPWPRYDQVVVHDFIFGGMENTACTSMTDVLLVDERACLEYDPDGLVSHELAHQWFGDYVTCRDWSQAWLNEAWATFMEVVWWEADREPDAATWYHYEQAQLYLAEDSKRYRRPMVSYLFRQPLDIFDRHLYEKGACIMSTLRHELGDEAFWSATKHYLTTNAFGAVHTKHFQDALEESTGRNMDRFFDQWILGAGHPELAVKLVSEEGLLSVSVTQSQQGRGVAEVFHFTLRLEIVFEEGSSIVVDLPVKERDRCYTIPVAQKVSKVRVDPGFRFLSSMKISGARSLLTGLLNDPCPVLVVRAAAGLMETGSPDAFKAVIKAGEDHPFYAVRAEVASMLGARGGETCRDALIAAFKTEKDPRVVRALATALGEFRDSIAANVLIERIEADQFETWQLHGALLAALGNTRDPRAIAVIRPHLEVDSWADVVRAGALGGLASTYDPAVLDDIIALSGMGNAERTRAAAAKALGALGNRVEAVRLKAAERLIEMVKEPGFREQLYALQAMGTLKEPTTEPTLAAIHRGAGDGRVCRMAYEALMSVRKGRDSASGAVVLNERLEKMVTEQEKLRARLDKMEVAIPK